MLYKFKSQAAAEVIMLQPDAETLLKIIGKSPAPQGIVTVDQVPAAVAALHKAIEAQEAAANAPAADKSDDETDTSGGVSLRSRAGPFCRTAAHRERGGGQGCGLGSLETP